MPKKVLIVDELSQCIAATDYFMVLVWSSYDAGGFANAISMPQWIEKNSNFLRAEYLRVVFDLGNTQIGKSTVSGSLEIRSGLSAWNASAIAQKCAFNQDEALLDCIKIIALDKIFDSEVGQVTIEIISKRKLRAKRVQEFFKLKGYSCQLVSDFSNKQRPSLIDYAKSICPEVLKVLVYLTLEFFKVIKPGNSQINNNADSEIIFFDVLAHLNHNFVSNGQFISNYWCDLIPLLNHLKVKTKWIHLFYRQKLIKNTAKAYQICNSFTANSNYSQSHKMINDLATVNIIYKSLIDYFKLIKKVHHVDSKIESHLTNVIHLTVWRIFKSSQKKSLFGVNIILYILRLNCFDDLLSNLPKQKIGFYLCENQPWEFALRWAWKTNGHGRLIGVAHSTIRYWDLRYHNDSRYYQTIEYTKIYRNQIAVNGPAALNVMSSACFPIDDLIQVEALRYNYLEKKNDHKTSLKCTGDHYLVVGDFLPEINDLVFDYIARLCKDQNRRLKITFKPHPEFPYVVPREASKLADISLVDKSLGEIMPKFSTVISGVSSSAAVDAYCVGKKVIQIVDAKVGLNSSPLRGWPFVLEAKTYNDFRNFITEQESFSTSVRLTDFFQINNQLHQWRKFFVESQVS